MKMCKFEGHCWHIEDDHSHDDIYRCCGCTYMTIMPKGKEPEDGYILGRHTSDEVGP